MIAMVITDRGLVCGVLLLPEDSGQYKSIFIAWQKKHIKKGAAVHLKYQIRELEDWKGDGFFFWQHCCSTYSHKRMDNKMIEVFVSSAITFTIFCIVVVILYLALSFYYYLKGFDFYIEITFNFNKKDDE